MNKSELCNCTMGNHFTTNAPAPGFRITDFSHTFADHQTQLLQVINVDFFGKRRGWLGLISAFCLDFVLAGNSHGFCMANVPLVLFMIYGIFLLGVGSLGGYFSTTKNSWMHPVAIQAKSFHSDNYSLLQFSRFRWFTCMLRFQAVCRFFASWSKKPTLCLTPANCM